MRRRRARRCWLFTGAEPAGSNARDPRERTSCWRCRRRFRCRQTRALGGSAAAFDALSDSRALASRRSRPSLGPDVQNFDGSTELLKQSQAILGGREAIEGVQKAAGEVRALVPQLLQSLGNVVSALGSPRTSTA